MSGLGPLPLRLIDIDRVLDGGPKDEWVNTVSNGSFSKILAPGVRTGWADPSVAFAQALSQVGATLSGGCPTNLSAALVHEMVQSGKLTRHLEQIIIPSYRSRYNAMMRAIKEHLLPLRFTISAGKLFEQHSTDPINRTSKFAEEAGGYFLFLMIPKHSTFNTSSFSTFTLTRFNLRVAPGDTMAVEQDDQSLQRALHGFGCGLRLYWAWHTEGDIVEGIERLRQAYLTYIATEMR